MSLDMNDQELAMAYADGELDAVAAKRFEKRMAAEPALAEAVAAQQALRARLRQGFAPVAAAPVPDRFAALLEPRSNVVPFKPRAAAGPAPRWQAAALAACLVGGVVIGQVSKPVGRPDAPVAVSDGKLVAGGTLARALDRQLAADAPGDTRMLASFKDSGGAYCRVFMAPAADGIACRESGGWTLRQTRSASGAKTEGGYRQAGSDDAALLVAAQEMMAGDPLDAEGERRARDGGWR